MKNEWTTTIKSKSSWFDINFYELFKYKDLIGLFVKRNYTTRYKQTILGPAWLVLSPLCTVITYVVVFGGIAGLSTDGAPQILFYLAGNIIWRFFNSSVIETSNTFISNAPVFGKVYFPRLVAPITSVITAFFDLCIQFVLFMVFIFIFMAKGWFCGINWTVVYTPLLIVQLGILGMGVGIIISALTTKYRDLRILVDFGLQLWMYASPIIYSITLIPQKYLPLYMLNPIASIVNVFKYAYLGIGEISYGYWVTSFGISIIILFIGIILFNHIEKNFMDTI